jgi:glycosyltransferase involved in cell wall biosynthesis
MKVAVFTDTYAPQINGVVTSILTMEAEFRRMGHEVVVFCPRIKNARQSTPTVRRFHSVEFPFQREYHLSTPWSRQLKSFKDEGFDIIHAQTPFSLGFTAAFLAKRHHLPLVHTYHTYFEEYIHYIPLPRPVMSWFAEVESRRFCNRCDVVIAPSKQMKEKLLDYDISVPIEVIPTGVVTDTVLSATEIAGFRARLGLKDDHRLLVFAGRLGLEKNVFFLLESFRAVRRTFSDIKLVIVGDGPQRAAMEEKVRRFGLEGDVVFTGYLPHREVLIAFKAATLCVFPSVTETQGLTVLESMAMGTPVVGIDAMGVGELLHNNVGGFATEGSLDGFSHATIRLLEDLSLLDQKQAQAALRAQTEYSAQALSKKLVSVYEAAIRKRSLRWRNAPSLLGR